MGDTLIEIRGGPEVRASGEILVDHGLGGAECFVLNGFDIALVGVDPHNIVFTLLLKNKRCANTKSADSENGDVVFGQSHEG